MARPKKIIAPMQAVAAPQPTAAPVVVTPVTPSFPTVTSHSDTTVTLGFTAGGQSITVELPKTMIKGQARWAAKRLQDKGAVVPQYGTKECKDWAESLRQAAGN